MFNFGSLVPGVSLRRHFERGEGPGYEIEFPTIFIWILNIIPIVISHGVEQ